MTDRINKAFLRNLAELHATSVKYLEYLKWSEKKKDEITSHLSRTAFPKIKDDEVCLFEGWFNGESLVKIDSKLYGQLNELQKKVVINTLCDGKIHEITVETVPRSLFGMPTDEVRHIYSRIAVYDEEMLNVIYYLR
ncbi:MAG: hypothetical protein J7L34_02140, partial [Thermotogaceae bacterium]|nr:hypothetical protein [Thermotogaceae bacterium]